MLNKVTKPVDVQPISSSSGNNMEQLGLMASSIAHDFNNLLTNIMGHMSLALLKTSQEDDSRLHIEQAVKTAEYAAALTSQLLNYSRQQSQAPFVEYIDLNNEVNDTVELVESVLLTDLVVDLNLNMNLPQIRASKTHVQQIIMNLLINAAEAIGNPLTGTIEISTGRCQKAIWKTAGVLWGQNDFAPSDYIYLQVKDNGRGIDTENLTKIFDPFFSTKPKGRGLGLSTIGEIVKEYEGFIHVQSEPDHGTTFRICFPFRADNFSKVH